MPTQVALHHRLRVSRLPAMRSQCSTIRASPSSSSRPISATATESDMFQAHPVELLAKWSCPHQGAVQQTVIPCLPYWHEVNNSLLWACTRPGLRASHGSTSLAQPSKGQPLYRILCHNGFTAASKRCCVCNLPRGHAKVNGMSNTKYYTRLTGLVDGLFLHAMEACSHAGGLMTCVTSYGLVAMDEHIET